MDRVRRGAAIGGLALFLPSPYYISNTPEKAYTLLARLDPRRFAAPWEMRKDGAADPQAEARAAFPAQLDAICDLPSE